MQLALASITLVDLEHYANRAPLFLRHELAPQLRLLRTIETTCADWLLQPQAFDSPKLTTAAAILQARSDALQALSMCLTPQAFTHHLQQREALADRGRTATSLLPRHERSCDAVRAYFAALMRLDTTDDRDRLPDAMDQLRTAIDDLCAFVARRRDAQWRPSVAPAAPRPAQTSPGAVRIAGDRKRPWPDATSSTFPSTSPSTSTPLPREIPKHRRLGDGSDPGLRNP
ncbi:hypothetical protein CDL60_20870 [Roseateles noduli]|nr:hypothetical protein CDL60_20870 [Roseateles noduli]